MAMWVMALLRNKMNVILQGAPGVAPDPVGLVVDPEDSDGDSGASRWASPFGITAQAIDAAVQRHKHAVHIHHTDSTDITVANGISAQSFLIRIFSRLFHRGGDPNMITVAAVHIQDLDQDALAGLEVGRRVHPALVAQFFKGNVALHTEQVDEDSCTDGRDNSGFCANAGIDAVVAVPVCAEIHFFSSGTHGFQAARRCNTGFGIDTFYDVIDFGAEALGQHVMKYLIRVTPTIIFGRFDCLSGRNDLPAGCDVPELVSDHGSQPASTAFRGACEALGINQIFASYGNPKGNADTERMMRTIKEDLIYSNDFQTFNELETALATWTKRYNEEFLHSTLGYESPIEYENWFYHATRREVPYLMS